MGEENTIFWKLRDRIGDSVDLEFAGPPVNDEYRNCWSRT
jgi:hypothetical protein